MPKNAFTKGPYKKGEHVCLDAGKLMEFSLGNRTEAKANALLAEAAFNTATNLAELGCDAQKAIEALPKLIERLMAVQERLALNHAANRRCLPSHSVERMVREITDTLDDAGLLTKAKGEEA